MWSVGRRAGRHGDRATVWLDEAGEGLLGEREDEDEIEEQLDRDHALLDVDVMLGRRL